MMAVSEVASSTGSDKSNKSDRSRKSRLERFKHPDSPLLGPINHNSSHFYRSNAPLAHSTRAQAAIYSIVSHGASTLPRSNLYSNFASVNEQSGFRAGDGGFDAAGQWMTTGQIRPVQTLIAVGTGAVAAPFASTSASGNAGVSALVGGGNAAFSNAWYGTGTVDDILYGGLYCGAFGGLGTRAGNYVTSASSNALPRYIGGQPINPRVPILLQNFGTVNPWPTRIGGAVQQGVSNAPSFFPQPKVENKP